MLHLTLMSNCLCIYMQGGPDLGNNVLECSSSIWKSFRCDNLSSVLI